MDRIMTVEERIRRAENIYNKRNGNYTNISKNEKKSKKKSIKKLLMQIFICITVYVIFYAINNRDYIFSVEFRKEVNELLTQKTKISEWYNETKNFFINIINEEQNDEQKNEKNKEEENKVQKEEIKEENKEQNENQKESTENKEENIGGATDEIKNEQHTKQPTEQQIMEKEAKEIKNNISFIIPITGRISSTYGWRNPTTSTVPKYHTGIDIAAKEGTIIKSATDGKIIMSSDKGDYGNHYQIQVKDIIIVYAHCKKLYLKEGDMVKQGQEIEEVRNTGNSTGPHLHFEIRKGEKKIDPQLILKF